jgi:hypothetical protein
MPSKHKTQMPSPARTDLEKRVNGLLFLNEEEKGKLSFAVKNIREPGLLRLQKIIDEAYKKQAKWFKQLEKENAGFLFGMKRKIKFLSLKNREEKDKKK